MDAGALGVYAALFFALFFEVFLLISFFEKRPEEKSLGLPKRYPTVAVLVPCWNKGATLSPTIHSLLELDYPKDKLSIVIIDDGSTDNTWEAAQEFAHNPQVRLYQKENEGSKYSALNFGLEHTDSEFVGCLDADSFVAKDALLEMIKAFEADPEAMAAAPEGQETLYVLVPVGHLDARSRQDWEALVNRARETVLTRLAKEMEAEDLREHIKFEIAYWPPVWKDRFNLEKGAAFGLSHNFWQVGYLRPQNRHKQYKNLYFAGASTHPGTGLPIVLLSARLTTERILKEAGTISVQNLNHAKGHVIPSEISQA